MAGISPKLPLYRDPDDGLGLNKTHRESIRQNFIVLLKTSPGERIMDSEFGCGLKNILFENDNPGLYGQIHGKIQTQVKKYMNFIQINSINITPPDENGLSHVVSIMINYTIKPLNANDSLFLEIPSGEL